MAVTGHIRQRKSKSGKVSYQIIIETAKDPSSQKRNRYYSTVNGTKKEAERQLQNKLREMSGENYLDTSNILLRDFVPEWYSSKEHTLKRSTLSRYQEQLNWYVLPRLGQYPIKALSSPVIQRWVNEIYIAPPTRKKDSKSDSVKPLSAKTVKNIFLNLKAILDYAKLRKLIASNPCDSVNLPKIDKKELEVYSDEEIKKILSSAEGTDLQFPIYLLLCTGMRRGELLGLRWRNVYLEEKYIEITETKIQAAGNVYTDTPKSKNSRRKIPIGDDLIKEFKQYRLRNQKIFIAKGKKVSQDDYVLCRQDGTEYDPDDFLRLWKRFLEHNGIRYLKLHALRHSFATMLLQAKYDPKTVGDLLGHADSNLVLSTYGHTFSETKREAVEGIGKKLNYLVG